MSFANEYKRNVFFDARLLMRNTAYEASNDF